MGAAILRERLQEVLQAWEDEREDERTYCATPHLEARVERLEDRLTALVKIIVEESDYEP